MTTILDKIIVEKIHEVAKLKQLNIELPVGKREKHSFIEKLKRADKICIIAEFKRASPSKGEINGGVDPAIQTKAYVEGGADAVSVLTDTPFFKGSFSDLEAARKTINCPILCKDFIIDPVQIDMANRNGADIILLIAAALEDDKLFELYRYATERNLEVLMEVHNKAELERVLKTGNQLIGVNNRNLKTFEVDLAVTEELAGIVKESGAFLISESGMRNAADVQRVVNAGANGILVGETFMKHTNLAQALTEMKLPLKGVSR